MRVRSLVLVGLQAAALVALAASGPLLVRHPAGLIVELAGVALGAWAVATMRFRHLRATPEPAAGSRLVTHGPYRWIRHPMYTATLAVVGAWLLDTWSPARSAMALTLVGVFAIKIRIEERLLAQHFQGYADYARRTKRLLPGLW